MLTPIELAYIRDRAAYMAPVYARVKWRVAGTKGESPTVDELAAKITEAVNDLDLDERDYCEMSGFVAISLPLSEAGRPRFSVSFSGAMLDTIDRINRGAQ